MDILKRKRTSKCTDGSVVYEYTLNESIDQRFLTLLQDFGSLEMKELGGLIMFTFKKDDWLTLKGMTDDNIFYTTHLKTQSAALDEFITSVLSVYNQSSE